jgi:hypothetical protein
MIEHNSKSYDAQTGVLYSVAPTFDVNSIVFFAVADDFRRTDVTG